MHALFFYPNVSVMNTIFFGVLTVLTCCNWKPHSYQILIVVYVYNLLSHLTALRMFFVAWLLGFYLVTINCDRIFTSSLLDIKPLQM